MRQSGNRESERREAPKNCDVFALVVLFLLLSCRRITSDIRLLAALGCAEAQSQAHDSGQPGPRIKTRVDSVFRSAI